jgi:hypothetical protein
MRYSQGLLAAVSLTLIRRLRTLPSGFILVETLHNERVETPSFEMTDAGTHQLTVAKRQVKPWNESVSPIESCNVLNTSLQTS